MIYYLHWLKETTKKVCNSIMDSVKLWCKITIIFMNSENSKTCDPYRLIENLPEKKIDSKPSNKYVALSNVSVYTHRKI